MDIVILEYMLPITAWFSEAFSLWSITTLKIISALAQLLVKVGIPDEVLMNQKTNLRKWFNQILKNMLRKFVSELEQITGFAPFELLYGATGYAKEDIRGNAIYFCCREGCVVCTSNDGQLGEVLERSQRETHESAAGTEAVV